MDRGDRVSALRRLAALALERRAAAGLPLPTLGAILLHVGVPLGQMAEYIDAARVPSHHEHLAWYTARCIEASALLTPPGVVHPEMPASDDLDEYPWNGRIIGAFSYLAELQSRAMNGPPRLDRPAGAELPLARVLFNMAEDALGMLELALDVAEGGAVPPSAEAAVQRWLPTVWLPEEGDGWNAQVDAIVQVVPDWG